MAKLKLNKNKKLKPTDEYSVDEARLQRTDYFRCQVKLTRAERLIVAVCYNAMSARNKKVAGRLRDQFGPTIIRLYRDHFRTLLSEREFQDEYAKWVDENVHPELYAEVEDCLKKNFPEFLKD